MHQLRNLRRASSVALIALAACAAPPSQPPVSAPPVKVVDGCLQPPLGETTLYLRGSLNAWGALDEYAFQFRCDAYYLNVDAHGGHDFKVADAAWGDATTFGAGAGKTALLESGGVLRPQRSDSQSPMASRDQSLAAPRSGRPQRALRLAMVHKRPFGAVA
jgi:cyclomaltodextrinase